MSEAHELIGHDRGRRVPLCPAGGREGLPGRVPEAVRDGVPRRRQQQQRRGADLRRAGAVCLQLRRRGWMCARAGGPRSRDDPVSARARTSTWTAPLAPCRPGQAAARRRESRELALRLADYVKEHGIDLVLLAGDLFDSASPFRETGEQLAAALGQMRARVFISPGNHDWYGPGSPWETVDWPENVYVFKENRLDGRGGAGAKLGDPRGGILPARNSRRACWRVSPPRQTESVTSACSMGSWTGRRRGTAPSAGKRSAASGLCYLALGHVHKRTAPLTLRADGLRLARLSGGPGVRRAGGEGLLRGDDLRRRRGLPDLCALCPAPV